MGDNINGREVDVPTFVGRILHLLELEKQAEREETQKDIKGALKGVQLTSGGPSPGGGFLVKAQPKDGHNVLPPHLLSPHDEVQAVANKQPRGTSPIAKGVVRYVRDERLEFIVEEPLDLDKAQVDSFIASAFSSLLSNGKERVSGS